MVDYKKDTIEYLKNGKSQGVAFRDTLKGQPVRPAVLLYCTETGVRIENLNVFD